MYWTILFFSSILSQGIFGIFLEDNDDKSSDLHFREKRAITAARAGHRELTNADVTYIVEVLKNDVRICAGIIVSPEHILSIKECVNQEAEEYTVKSGHLFINTIKIHSVKDKVVVGNLALLLIDPLITLQSPSPNRSIRLHDGHVEALTLSTISSFTPNDEDNEPTIFRQLSQVQIVRLQLCINYYKRSSRVITKDNICALESSGGTGFTAKDRGSALVLDGQLVGVLVHPGNLISHTSPDVFLRVNDGNIYNRWIKSHIEPYLSSQVNAERPSTSTQRTHAPQTHATQTHATQTHAPQTHTSYLQNSPNRSPYLHTTPNQSPYPYASPNYSSYSHTSPIHSPHPHTSQNYSPLSYTSQTDSPRSQTSLNISSASASRSPSPTSSHRGGNE